jgi:hypothetical protein
MADVKGEAPDADNEGEVVSTDQVPLPDKAVFNREIEQMAFDGDQMDQIEKEFQ